VNHVCVAAVALGAAPNAAEPDYACNPWATRMTVMTT